MDQVREVLRVKHYAIRTEQAYCEWIRRYVRFHGMRSREELFPGTEKVELFLSDLAVNGRVAASTQNRAFNALLFLYGQVLHQQDVRDGFGSVYLHGALERKYPDAAREWQWQYVFPARDRSSDPRSGAIRRHHQEGSCKAIEISAPNLSAALGLHWKRPVSQIRESMGRATGHGLATGQACHSVAPALEP